LWRRVLLERAAYRLLTCDRSVLEVAVEAGYSCHEVFTRACQRGEAAAWRAAPRQIQLGARTGCTSADGQAVAACRAKVTAMDLLTRMAGHHIWLAGEVIGRARRRTG
jgi:hypothetical protein